MKFGTARALWLWLTTSDPDISNKWATRINREFFAQCDLEKELNLKVSAWMDYKKIILAKEQMNFIGGLCMPLYK